MTLAIYNDRLKRGLEGEGLDWPLRLGLGRAPLSGLPLNASPIWSPVGAED